MVNITETKLHDRYDLKDHNDAKDTINLEDSAYFDSELMLFGVLAENVCVTSIKSNTAFEQVEAQDLPENTDQDILKDQIIKLT